MPFSRVRGRPAPLSAGCHATALKPDLCSAEPPGSVNTSLAVTSLPSGTFHGSSTGTGGLAAICAASRSATLAVPLGAYPNQ